MIANLKVMLLIVMGQEWFSSEIQFKVHLWQCKGTTA